MKKELIKTQDYLLVVDDSEIKFRDWFLNPKPGYEPKRFLKRGAFEAVSPKCDKVIAHLPLNNSPILKGVPLLPPIEDDDVWSMGLEARLKELPYTKHLDDGMFNDGQVSGFESGAEWSYNKAREKYKFTEEDIRDVIMLSFLLGVDRSEYSKEFEDEIIKKFSQAKTYTHFEFEMRDALISPMGREVDPMNFDQNQSSCIWQKVIKTTTNSQGQQVACGKYIFEL